MSNNGKLSRRSIRLYGYDYSVAGAYFVTICTHRRECIFGRIPSNGNVTLNRYGRIAFEEWRFSAEMREEMDLDAFVVMPNHVHGIVVIEHDICGNSVVGAQGLAPLQKSHIQKPSLYRPPRSLGSFIAGYKMAVTKRINVLRKTPGAPV
jgi:REP element-mobilizing transposase RayT